MPDAVVLLSQNNFAIVCKRMHKNENIFKWKVLVTKSKTIASDVEKGKHHRLLAEKEHSCFLT